MPRIDHIADLVTAGRVALLLEKENVRLHARLDAMSLARCALSRYELETSKTD